MSSRRWLTPPDDKAKENGNAKPEDQKRFADELPPLKADSAGGQFGGKSRTRKQGNHVPTIVGINLINAAI